MLAQRLKKIQALMIFSLPILLTLIPGCGYSLQHRLKDTFKPASGIFVPVFTNHTEQVGAERAFTNALIRELSSRREVVLSSREAGGLELKGTIRSIQVTVTAQSEPGFKGLQPYRRLPTEIGVQVSLLLELRQLKDSPPLWTKEFSGFRRITPATLRTFSYEAQSAQGPATQSVVEQLFTELAPQMMREVYDDMVELF